MRTAHHIVPGDGGLVTPDGLLYQQLGLHDVVVPGPRDLDQSLASTGNNPGDESE